MLLSFLDKNYLNIYLITAEKKCHYVSASKVISQQELSVVLTAVKKTKYLATKKDIADKTRYTGWKCAPLQPVYRGFFKKSQHCYNTTQ